jgi:hypothetical protein
VTRTPQAPADDAVLRVGDRVRMHLDFSKWIGTRPTAILVVASLTRTKDDVVILALRWGPSAAPGGPEIADR